MASSFKFDIGNVIKGIDRYSNRMSAGLDLYAEVVCKKLESYAKDKRPWVDRTSHAKQSIQGVSGRDMGNLVIGVSGGMEYSPFLEFANDKKYAILYPTIMEHKKEILQGIKNIVR